MAVIARPGSLAARDISAIAVYALCFIVDECLDFTCFAG
jgi:hypothetical protein